MSGYLGVPGAMVRVPSPAVSMDNDVRRDYRMTLGGQRVVQHPIGRHRSWTVSVDAIPPDVLTHISSFAAGEFGLGPFWWADPWAQVTNLLTPAASMLRVGQVSGTSVEGAVTLGGNAYAGRHLMMNLSVTLPRVDGSEVPVPVRHGYPVTVSAWVSGEVRLEIIFLNVDQDVVSTITGPYHSTEGWERISLTSELPEEGAASVLMRVRGNSARATRPAITWTPEARPYHLGSGASQVVIDDLSQTLVVAGSQPRRQFAGASFTLQEVGF